MTMLFHRKRICTKIICAYFSAVIDAIDYESFFKVVIKFKNNIKCFQGIVSKNYKVIEYYSYRFCYIFFRVIFSGQKMKSGKLS